MENKTKKKAGRPAKAKTTAPVLKKEDVKAVKLPDAFKFDGVELGKGRYMLAVVKGWVKDHPKSDAKKLEEAFPHLLVHRYGVFETLKVAQEKSKIRKRYFIDEADVVECGGKRFCVTNQVTGEILTKFLAHCKAAGIRTK
jgi:hypothetical protein